jgi:hypothetical protein
MCVCIIFPHLLKIYQVDKNGINVVLYLLVIIFLKKFEKYVIYETNDIIFNILNFYKNCLNCLNVIFFIKFYCE